MLSKTNIYIAICSLIFSYVITGILLLFTAFLLYKLEPEQSLVAAGILVIYVFSSFWGGMFCGKKIGTRKFVWGLVTGAVYFLFLFLASWMCGGIQAETGKIITTLLLCLGGGMLGGMLA